MQKKLFLPVLILVFCTLYSCGVSRPQPYLNALPANADSSIRYPELKIEKGDQLSVVIYSDNPVVTEIFNQAAGSAVAENPSLSPSVRSTSSSSGQGYTVGPDGAVTFHTLGRVPVEGLTLRELNDLVRTKLESKNVLSNPYVISRFLNSKVTILGEVRTPGAIPMPGERLNILQAIGLAGDMTNYGRKDDVTIIRETNGHRSIQKLNLSSPDVFNSPFFYLKQNDLVIVGADPKKTTATDEEISRNVTVIAAAVSAVAIIITLFR